MSMKRARPASEESVSPIQTLTPLARLTLDRLGIPHLLESSQTHGKMKRRLWISSVSESDLGKVNRLEVGTADGGGGVVNNLSSPPPLSRKRWKRDNARDTARIGEEGVIAKDLQDEDVVMVDAILDSQAYVGRASSAFQPDTDTGTHSHADAETGNENGPMDDSDVEHTSLRNRLTFAQRGPSYASLAIRRYRSRDLSLFSRDLHSSTGVNSRSSDTDKRYVRRGGNNFRKRNTIRFSFLAARYPRSIPGRGFLQAMDVQAERCARERQTGMIQWYNRWQETSRGLTTELFEKKLIDWIERHHSGGVGQCQLRPQYQIQLQVPIREQLHRTADCILIPNGVIQLQPVSVENNQYRPDLIEVDTATRRRRRVAERARYDCRQTIVQVQDVEEERSRTRALARVEREQENDRQEADRSISGREEQERVRLERLHDGDVSEDLGPEQDRLLDMHARQEPESLWDVTQMPTTQGGRRLPQPIQMSILSSSITPSNGSSTHILEPEEEFHVEPPSTGIDALATQPDLPPVYTPPNLSSFESPPTSFLTDSQATRYLDYASLSSHSATPQLPAYRDLDYGPGSPSPPPPYNALSGFEILHVSWAEEAVFSVELAADDHQEMVPEEANSRCNIM